MVSGGRTGENSWRSHGAQILVLCSCSSAHRSWVHVAVGADIMERPHTEALISQPRLSSLFPAAFSLVHTVKTNTYLLSSQPHSSRELTPTDMTTLVLHPPLLSAEVLCGNPLMTSCSL